jgi:EamA domain-containing membrane protein RarD
LVAVIVLFYAVARKRLKIDPILGLFIEMSILLSLTPTSFGWLVWSGLPLFFGGAPDFVLLAVFLHVLTVATLIFFHASNQLLSMTTAGLLF